MAELISTSTNLTSSMASASASSPSFVEPDTGMGVIAPAPVTDSHLLEAFPSNAEALLHNVTMASGSNITTNDLLSALGMQINP